MIACRGHCHAFITKHCNICKFVRGGKDAPTLCLPVQESNGISACQWCK